MCSTESQNHLVTSNLSPDTIVSFKQDSELKSYIKLKTGIIKLFFTLGEIIAILRTIIKEEKQYDERNPALIICSEELKPILNCRALHYKELKTAIISHLAFTQEYLGKVGGPETCYPNTKSFATHIWTNKKAQFKLKDPFLRLIQSTSRINRNRTVFTYQEVCILVCKYIRDRRNQFFHDQNIKICWVHHDLLGTCFNVSAFHFVQLKELIWSQLITCYIQTRKSPRLSNHEKPQTSE